MSLFSQKYWYEAAIARNPKWREVRAGYLANFPECACCGDKSNLNVHHIKPYHLFPELELDLTNLITLCEGGPINCHFIVGHGGENWRAFTPPERLQIAIEAVQQGIKFLQGMTCVS